PSRILLAGGGARLNGLPDRLARELAIPVEPLRLIESPLTEEPYVSSEPLPAQALGLALAAAAPVPQVNLRRGELAYRTDYSYLRGKARYLAAAVVAILAFAAINAVSSLRALRKEADGLEFRLKAVTIELFGVQR